MMESPAETFKPQPGLPSEWASSIPYYASGSPLVQWHWAGSSSPSPSASSGPLTPFQPQLLPQFGVFLLFHFYLTHLLVDRFSSSPSPWFFSALSFSGPE